MFSNHIRSYWILQYSGTWNQMMTDVDYWMEFVRIPDKTIWHRIVYVFIFMCVCIKFNLQGVFEMGKYKMCCKFNGA